jgi:hypothetical protein
MQKLLSIGSNPKINKSDKSGQGYKTAILHLSPYKLSGRNLCPDASEGCIAGCLNTAGHGRFDKTQSARLKRTKFFINDREGFMHQLILELWAFVRHCRKRDLKPTVRLNGTSDIPWENIRFTTDKYDFPCNGENIFEWFPMIQFYDYTKSKRRVLKKSLPSNYHLTFSRSETTKTDDIRQVLDSGNNVAIVFDRMVNGPIHMFKKDLTGGHDKAIDGDKTDLRFLDPSGVVVALSAKGKAKQDKSGFVVPMSLNKWDEFNARLNQ